MRFFQNDRLIQWIGISCALILITGVYFYFDTQASLKIRSFDTNDGLIGYWSFEEGEGSQAGDMSGNGNHGTLTNMDASLDWVKGARGAALDFDGDDDEVIIPHASALDPDDITVSLWFNGDTNMGSGEWSELIVKGKWITSDTSSPIWSYAMEFEASSDDLKWAVNDDLTSENSVSAVNMPSDTWVHAVGTYNGTTKKSTLYINGAYVGETTLSGTRTKYAGDVSIGHYGDGEGSAGGSWDGSVDEVRIYNRVLSYEEIMAFYEKGQVKMQMTQVDDLMGGLVGMWSFDGSDISGTTAYDRSGGGGDGTLTNGPVAVMGKIGQALEFNGSDNFVDVEIARPLLDDVNISVITDSSFDSVSGTHTVSSGTDLLIVMLQGWVVGETVAEGGPPSSVTWNGTSLTSLSLPSAWADSQHAVWYLADPTPSENETLLISGGDSSIADGGVVQMYNLSNVDTSVGTSGIRSATNDEADSRTTITLSPTTTATDLIVAQWSQQAGVSTTGQSYGGTSGTQSIQDSAGFNGDAVFLATSRPTGSGQNITFLEDSGTNFPSGVALSLASSGETMKTFSFWVKTDEVTTSFMDIDGSANIDLSSGTVRANNFTSPNIYVDKVVTSTLPNDSDWHHVVVTTSTEIDGSGIEFGRIGAAYYDGALDDVRMYDRVLTTSEIGSLYNLGQGVKTQVSQVEKDAGGLVGMWSFDGPDISGTTATDQGSGGNDGTLINGPVPTLGKMGQAMDFDGDDDHITAPDSSAYSGLSAITASAWFNFDSLASGYQFIVGKSNWDSQREWRIRLENSGNKLVWHVSNDGNDPDTAEAVYTLSRVPVHTWHHVVGTYDDNDSDLLKLYLNGALVDVTTGEAGPIFDGSANLAIGSSGDNGGSTLDDFDGSIDEVRVYDRALTQEEILEMYQRESGKDRFEIGLTGYWPFLAGSGSQARDQSEYGFHGSLVNMEDVDWVRGERGYALDLDGTDESISLSGSNDIIVTKEFTVSAWANMQGVGGGTSAQNVIFQQRDNLDGDNLSAIVLMSENTSGNADFMIRSSSGSAQSATVAAENNDEWHHYTGVVDSENVTLFIDGEQAAQVANAQSGDYETSIDNMDIGRHRYDGTTHGRFNGLIDEVRAYDRALSVSDVRLLYQRGR